MRYTYFDIFTNPCSGEEVVGEGEIQLIITYVEDPSGARHFTLHQVSHGTAVGVSTGDRYVITGVDQEMSQALDFEGPFTLNLTGTYTAPGSGNNFFFRLTWIGEYVDGEVVMHRLEESATCPDSSTGTSTPRLALDPQ
jgi:hypothetical protein